MKGKATCVTRADPISGAEEKILREESIVIEGFESRQPIGGCHKFQVTDLNYTLKENGKSIDLPEKALSYARTGFFMTYLQPDGQFQSATYQNFSTALPRI